MRKAAFILLLSLLLAVKVGGQDAASAAEASAAPVAVAEEVIDISGVILGHVGDDYEWHITDIGETKVAIPLPVIVRTHDGSWHCFSSHHLYEEGEWQGLRIAPDGAAHEGKVVEADGKRPLDISITKNVLSLMMSSLLLALLVLLSARWYRRHDSLREAPGGVAAVLEPLVTMVDGMARDNIGEGYKRFSPYLITAFLFILLNNFMGIIPFFPGGANVTGNIAVTLVLALFTFFIFMGHGTRHYYSDMLNPEVPGILKPLMALIEVFSTMMRPLSLTIRLFANMLAGHIQILSIVCVIFIMAKFGAALFGGMTLLSVLFGLFLDALEILISFIQAYVFTMLSAVYIGIATEKGEAGR